MTSQMFERVMLGLLTVLLGILLYLVCTEYWRCIFPVAAAGIVLYLVGWGVEQAVKRKFPDV